ncbi:MAG: TerC family protein [Pedosphaera sp.]|nr:TerC family protein [Pedosphaera sp.]
MTFDWITSADAWVSLFTLTFLEIVLGIDNLIFISILSGKLPEAQRPRARQVGLALALVTRVLLLCSLAWVMRLDEPFWHVNLFGLQLPGSAKELILFFGGLFLLGKSVWEIHEKIEGHQEGAKSPVAASFANIVVQIILLDIIFSLDSVITAVGMASQLAIMIIAVIVSVVIMLVFVNAISSFVDRHPTIKMLALSFLILIGTLLLAESFHQHIAKGYVYFAMAFSFGVECLNIRVRGHRP